MATTTDTVHKPVTVLQKFFGRRPGDTLQDFAAEIKALSDQDKVQLVGGIVDGTLTY